MLTIQEGMKISAVKELFNQEFPFLKLEFFKHRHGVYGGNGRRDLHQSEEILKQKSKEESGKIILKDELKVSELEQLFYQYYGLSAQVFRKSGRSWLETTVTDDWTLKRQNDEGRELSQLNEG